MYTSYYPDADQVLWVLGLAGHSLLHPTKSSPLTSFYLLVTIFVQKI